MLNPEAAGARPRIALLSPSLVGTGGAERVVSTLSQMLSQQYEVYELSFDPADASRYFASPARFVPLGPSLRLPLALRPISYALDAFRLWRAKRRLGVSLTISNLWRADLLSVLSMGTDRKVAICHINIVDNATNRLLLRFLPLVSWIYRRFDRVVSVSHPLGDEISGLFRLDRSKSRVIHNAVPLGAVEHRARESRRTRIAWCGRFVAEKNVLTLIQIFAQARESNSALQLVLIGNGPLRSEAEMLIVSLGLKVGASLDNEICDVTLIGFVSNAPTYIARCDFQVLPSIAEGLALVLIEGFTAAIPALASDCGGGGVHDTMGGASAFRLGRTEPERTTCGYLLPVPQTSLPETMDIWRRHLLLLAANAELRQRLAEGARVRASLFAPEVISPRWFQLLGEIL